jgi:hypothetical protein
VVASISGRAHKQEPGQPVGLGLTAEPQHVLSVAGEAVELGHHHDAAVGGQLLDAQPLGIEAQAALPLPDGADPVVGH